MNDYLNEPRSIPEMDDAREAKEQSSIEKAEQSKEFRKEDKEILDSIDKVLEKGNELIEYLNEKEDGEDVYTVCAMINENGGTNYRMLGKTLALSWQLNIKFEGTREECLNKLSEFK